MAPSPVAARRATLHDVFAIGEFRVLWLAQLLSGAGDQLAMVALTVLVYDRTRSPLLAAATYAASVAPTLAGGIVLAGLADKFPRRRVMIGCDLLRAALILLMLLPGTPPAALVGLLATVTFCEAPFMAARAAVYPEVLPGARYALGTAVTLTACQFAQVAGFAAGGATVALFGVRLSLLADAATFGLSALIIRLGMKARPPVAADRASRRSTTAAGIRLVFATPALRTPMLLGCLVAFYTVPEALAVPLAGAAGGGPVAAGLVLASGAAGCGIGMIAFGRFVAAATRERWVRPLAVAGCAVLIPSAAHPGLAALLAILLVSGACACYQPTLNAAFVAAAPAHQRSQVFGVALATITLAQAAAMVLAGAAAGRFPSTDVVAAAGVIGCALASAPMTVRACRVSRGQRDGHHQADARTDAY